MFTIDPNITELNVKEKDIAKLFFSMNSPQIATPELSTEDARCYVLVFRGGNTYQVYIGLFLLTSGRRFYYTYSGNPVSAPSMEEALDDASRFAEEMGFILDELKLSGMSVDDRNQWFDSQSMFAPPKPPEAPAPEPASADKIAAPAEEQKPEPSIPAEAAAEKPEAPAAMPAPAVAVAPAAPGASVITAQQIFPDEPRTAAPQTAPAAPAVPVQQIPVQQPPVQQPPQQAQTPAVEEHPEPAAPPEPPVAQAPQKQAVPRQKATPAPPEDEESSEEAAMESASSGVKQSPQAQKPRSKKAIQAATGTVSREYEALARLLASF